jgi:hypothetical protein
MSQKLAENTSLYFLDALYIVSKEIFISTVHTSLTSVRSVCNLFVWYNYISRGRNLFSLLTRIIAFFG